MTIKADDNNPIERFRKVLLLDASFLPDPIIGDEKNRRCQTKAKLISNSGWCVLCNNPDVRANRDRQTAT